MTQRGGNSRKASNASEFTTEQEIRSRRQCNSLLLNTIEKPFDETNSKLNGWNLRHEKNGIKIYKKFIKDKEMDQYISTGILSTNLSCLAYGLYSETNENFKILSSILYENEYLDAKILGVFETKDQFDSFKFSGIKYIKTQMPIQSAYATRDAVYYEYSGCRLTSTGKRYLFMIQDALQLKQVPPQKNIAREMPTIVYIFTELAGNRVHFTMESSVATNGLIPTWFYAFSYCQTSTRLISLPETRFLVSVQKFTDPSKWIPDSDRKSCIVCAKSFNPLRSRHHCRACGDIMCSACTIRIAYTPLYLHSDPSKIAMQEHKICETCMRNAKRELSMMPVIPFDEQRRPTSSSMGSPLRALSPRGIDPILLIEGAKALLRDESQSEPLRLVDKVDVNEQRPWASMDEMHHSDIPPMSPAAVHPIADATSQGFIICHFKDGELDTTKSELHADEITF